MKKLMMLAFAIALMSGFNKEIQAGWPPKIKVKSLGKYQQKAAAKIFGGVVGAGVSAGTTPFIGPYGGAAAGSAVGFMAGNHAEKKWTGKGLKNWRHPHKW